MPVSSRIRRYLRQNVLGLLALYVALGGVAWAAAIGSSDIKRNAVLSKHIKRGNVKASDVRANAITGSKVADNSLTGADVDELMLDLTVLQARLQGSCDSGKAIRAVSQTGAVTCESVGGGDITAVTAGSNLTGGGTAGDVPIALAPEIALAGVQASTPAASDIAVEGLADSGTGVVASTEDGLGLKASSGALGNAGWFNGGVRISRPGDTMPSGSSLFLVRDNTAGSAVDARSATGVGFNAIADSGTGVETYSETGTALSAASQQGQAATFNGRVQVKSLSGTFGDVGNGLLALRDNVARPAVLAENASMNAGYGVEGGASGQSGRGVFGEWVTNGTSDFGTGVYGRASGTGGRAVVGAAANGAVAGVFDGDVTVSGTLNVTGTKNFAIDHPLDPRNKILRHAAIESPEVLNVYTGNATTDRRGYATVRLPAYFSALNDERDVRFQLTPIGAFTQAIVARKVRANTFVIRTRRPRTQVSWEVSAVRDDRAMRANPFVAEEAKPAADAGKYLQPGLYGKPRSATLAR